MFFEIVFVCKSKWCRAAAQQFLQFFIISLVSITIAPSFDILLIFLRQINNSMGEHVVCLHDFFEASAFTKDEIADQVFIFQFMQFILPRWRNLYCELQLTDQFFLFKNLQTKFSILFLKIPKISNSFHYRNVWFPKRLCWVPIVLFFMETFCF